VPILELTAAGGAGVYSCLRLDLLAAILAPAGAAA
jgi:hypothetical protein